MIVDIIIIVYYFVLSKNIKLLQFLHNIYMYIYLVMRADA